MSISSDKNYIYAVDQSTIVESSLVKAQYKKTCGSAVLNKKQKAALKNPADDCLIFRISVYICKNLPCFIFTRTSRKVKISQAYEVWCHKRSDTLKKASQKRVLISDDILKNFLCPLSEDIPDCPVRAPNHCTYDRKFLREKLRELSGRKALPQGGPIFTLDAVYFDFAFANSVLDRLNALVIAIPKDPTFRECVNLKNLTGPCEDKYKNLNINREKNVEEVLKAAKSVMEEVKSSPTESVKLAEKVYNREVEDIGLMKDRLRTVYVCTNGPIAKFFIKMFGWAGAKRTMVKVDFLSTQFLEKVQTRGRVVEHLNR